MVLSLLCRSRPRYSNIREGAIVAERRHQTKYSPCVDQTEDEIGAYYRAAKEKDRAVVRQTQGHMLIYKLTEIEGINPSRGRVYQFLRYFTNAAIAKTSKTRTSNITSPPPKKPISPPYIIALLRCFHLTVWG